MCKFKNWGPLLLVSVVILVQNMLKLSRLNKKLTYNQNVWRPSKAKSCIFDYNSCRGGQLSKCPKMWLFWCKSCLHDKTRWLMKFKAKMTTPLVWTEIQFKFWHWVSILQAHYRPPSLNQGLFSSQNKTGGLPLWYQTILSFEKYIWWGLISLLFWHPFFWFSLREMGQNGASGQVLLRFAPFLLQW